MLRQVLSGCLIAASIAVVEQECHAQPQAVYQRFPVQQRQPGPYYRHPAYFSRGVQAGSFQRPYPYHLDYYRKQYGGGYEPYFGNLYGSPRIVGTQPFAFSPYPGSLGPPPHQPPYSHGAPPQAEPYLACPHCQQPVPLPWQAPQQAAPGATEPLTPAP